MNNCGLYRIVNKRNGKTYYGSSNNIKRRWSQHTTDLRGNYHHCSHLQNSWNKHGEESFEFSIFAYCFEESLLDYEQILLDLYVGKDYCYNESPDATAPFAGRQHTEETKAQMREAKLGENNVMYGKTHSDETKAKISAAKKGKPSKKKGVPEKKIECPHCGLVGGQSNMKRWHFDNCKQKTPAE